MPKFAARVHVILARKANTAKIFRRAPPPKSACTMMWDRTRDEFKLGQWLRGRIYEHRCDLSPDGKHFICFAMNGKRGGPVKGSRTAISCAPYLSSVPEIRGSNFSLVNVTASPTKPQIPRVWRARQG